MIYVLFLIQIRWSGFVDSNHSSEQFRAPGWSNSMRGDPPKIPSNYICKENSAQIGLRLVLLLMSVDSVGIFDDFCIGKK